MAHSEEPRRGFTRTLENALADSSGDDASSQSQKYGSSFNCSSTFRCVPNKKNFNKFFRHVVARAFSRVWGNNPLRGPSNCKQTRS